MLRFNLRQLEYLITCIDSGSLVAAAARLNVSQPSISTGIAKLEEQLGMQLLIRHHGQGVVPAAHARALIHSARDLLSHARDFQHSIELSGHEIQGELSIGSFTSLAPTYLPGLVAALGETYPNLRPRIGEGTQDQLIEGLRSGDYEVALVYDNDLPDDLEKKELLRVEPQVLLPKGHVLAKSQSVLLEDLTEHALILLDIAPSHQYFTGLFRAKGLVPRIGYRSSSLELVRGLVGQGLGYSLLVTRPPGDVTYDGQSLEIRPIAGEVEQSRIVLCKLRSVRQSRAARAFEELALSRLQIL